jgi:hypothetical protein
MHICQSCNTRAIYHHESEEGSFSFCKACMMKKLYDLVLVDENHSELTLGEIRAKLLGEGCKYTFKPTVSY